MKNLLLTVILFCLLGHGCTAQVDESTRPGYANAPLKYLALGDSYTIGTAIGEDSAYAARLARKLVEDLGNPVDLKIVAKNGWTTQDLLRGMTAEKPDSGYDLVTLLIGVNNQYQGKDLAHYSHDFTKLLHWAITLAAGDSERVFVISIPDYGVTRPAGVCVKQLPKILIGLTRWPSRRPNTWG
ncbi:MAG: GDSL-type esterase/lipase family protein [Owenweeksia sp.]|nr:GDSL-type esterase/lipase family protein [Owenweeksia sp.]